MIDATCAIDFSNHGGPVFSGRDRGIAVRDRISLLEIDRSCTRVKVVIPPDTYTVTSSFFLGLFEKVIQGAGTKEAFLQKYSFEMPPHIQNNLEYSISRALAPDKTLIS